MRNKRKEIFIDPSKEIPKIQEDKSKKPNRLQDCFKYFSKNSHIHCDNTNNLLFDGEDDLEIGQT